MYKHIILNKLLDYLKLKKYPVDWRSSKIAPTMPCPVCNNIAQKLPNNYKVNCFHCKQKYTLLDFAIKLEENFPKEEESQLQILRDILNVKVMTKKDEEDVYDFLKKYITWGFDLVRLIPNGKIPAEKDWTNKNHKDKEEWITWIKDGANIGVKTGAISGITIIDIDQKPIPPEIDKIKGDCIIQESTNGYHLIYKYEKDLPKTRIDDLKIDIENDGGQVVIYPSTIDNVQRKLIRLQDNITPMPEELKKHLLSKVTTPRKTFSEQVRDDIEQEKFNLGVLGAGQRNSSLVKLGGILRKELNLKQTNYALHVLNKHLCKNPLPNKEINAMIKSLDRYTIFDEQELAHQIVEYLKDVEEASRNEIAMAVVGSNRGEEKKRVDKSLKHLVKEGYILKHGNRYNIIKKAEWKESLIETGTKIDFKMPYFNDVANFNYGDLLLIGSKNKKGKCFAKGTGILMYDGSIKKVENIIPGDKVMGIDSTARNVLEIGTGREMMYEIIPNRGESFTVNESHILSLKKVGTEKVINISVKEFLMKDKTFQRTHYLYRVPIEFSETYLPIDPYYLGLWLGDGDKTNVRITTKDKEIKDYLEVYALNCGQKLIEYSYPNRCPSYAITYGERGGHLAVLDSLQSRLKNLGVLNNKHIPFIYKTNSRKHRLELLAGLIDSDGYLSEKKTAYEITITNKKLAEDIIYLARSLGFFSYLRTKISEIKSINYKTISYRLSICGNVTNIPVKIKRKKALPRTSNRNPLVTRFRIQKLHVDNYYGFSLDGDHLHLIDSFIVNHNTHISMNIVKQLVKEGIKPYYISLETGSRFAKIALQLGLKEGDFRWAFHSDPTQIELEPNAVTIIDWLLIVDKAKTDLVFKHFVEQLYKTNGILIVFMQLKDDNNWFAPNMVTQFPALATKYIYDNEDDGEYGQFKINIIRDPKLKTKNWNVPCQYDWETKELKKIEAVQNEENKGEDLSELE